MKFGTQMRRGHISKTAKINPEKGRGLGHVTLINFEVPLTYYKTSRARDFKFGTQIQSGNISKTAKKNLEKGHGLGHVTP